MKKIFLITIFVLGFSLAFAFLSPRDTSAQSCPGGCGPCDCGFSTQQIPNVGPRCFNNCTGGQVDSGCCYVTPNPPSCTPSAPGAATLLAPANGSLIASNVVTFNYASYTGWGNGCPNTNYFQLYRRVNDPVKGVGAWVLAYEASAQGPVTFGGFEWDTRYEWGVHKNNGYTVTWSGSWFFTTGKAPVITSFSVTGDVCGNNFSGSGSGLTTALSNPIGYSIQGTHNFQTSPASTIRFIGFALVPQSGAYSYNGDIMDFTSAITYAHNSRSVVFGYNYPDNSFYRYNGGTWTTAAGDQYNNFWNSAQAQYINSNAKSTSISGTNRIGSADFDTYFFDGFENFANTNGAFNIYAITIFLFSNGYEGSNDATATYPYVMRKVGTWGVDTSPPTVNVSNPSVNPDPTYFSVNWQASDNKSGLKDTYGFIGADDSDAALRDLTVGVDIPELYDIIPSDNLPLPQENGFISPANLGNHSYQNIQPDVSTDYYFKLFAEDNACNVVSNLGSGNVPSPVPAPVDAWLLSTGLISADGGYNVEVPNENIDIEDIYTGAAVLAVNNLISGNLILPDPRGISNSNSYLPNYNSNGGNDSTNPPISSDYDNWFEHLLDRAQRNTTVQNSSETNLNGNFSSSSNFNVSPNQQYTYLISNNVTIPTGAVCDMRAIIFIDGNLTINSGLTNSNTRNGCVFVVSGDVNVTPNGRQSSTDVFSGSLAEYDVVEAFIITDGNFETQTDPIPNGNETDEYDGLLIRGGVYADNVSLNHNINAGANQDQPAHIFEYDPRYKEFLRGYVSARFFSVRQAQ